MKTYLFESRLEGSRAHQATWFAKRWVLLVSVVATFVLVFTLGLLTAQYEKDAPVRHAKRATVATTSTAPAATTTLLRNFQVYPPVLTPNTVGELGYVDGSQAVVGAAVNVANKGCVKEKNLMTHSFASSYGTPFVGSYSPPSCSFNRVTLNMTVVTAGKQFDRLGIMYLGNIEIWRFTTAEPTPTGIVWTYIKDVTNYLSLFEKHQTLIFELDNIVDDTYTGILNVTLTATFFTSDTTITPADKIIPIDARLGGNNQQSVWEVPSANAANSVKIPRNTRRAVFTIAATGQIYEEDWWANAPNAYIDTFGAGSQGLFYPNGPFREVQLYIDNELAGVVWPYPVVFTGGVVPGIWRPIAGIDAFDLREDEIDITPWLGLLCDGKKHTFSILVAGIGTDANGKTVVVPGVNYFWYLSGKIFLWLDPSSSTTTGTITSYAAPAPHLTLTTTTTVDNSGANDTLTFTVTATRTFSVKATLKTYNGTTSVATWHQKLSYSNTNYYTNYGFHEVTVQSTTGTDKSSSGYARQINYPFYLDQLYFTNDTYTNISASIARTQTIQIAGKPVFPSGLQSFSFSSPPSSSPSSSSDLSTSLSTFQNGSGVYEHVSGSPSVSWGTTYQDMVFTGSSVDEANVVGEFDFPGTGGTTEYYSREVEAVNRTIVFDNEKLLGKTVSQGVDGDGVILKVGRRMWRLLLLEEKEGKEEGRELYFDSRAVRGTCG